MIDIMVDLQGGRKAPLYEKIYEYIRQEILDGKIPKDEKLPSSRLLSKNLSVSRSTVELAYGQLLAEGYIRTEPRRGFFVSDITDLYDLRGAKRTAGRRTEEKSGDSKTMIDFSPYLIDAGSFPFGIWRKLSKNVLLDDKEELLYTADGQGEPALREAIAGYLHQARGVNCTPSDIIIGAGNEYLEILLAQLCGRGKTVWMDDPGYPPAYHTFSNMGYHVLAVPATEDGIDLTLLYQTSPDLVYVMPSHQFPLGTVMPLKQRLALLKWAAKKEGRYLVEDDHDSEYRYRGKPIPSLQSIDGYGKVIYVGTFSKSIAPSLRISYMVLPPQLMEQYKARCGFYAATVPKIQQEILRAFIGEGHFERHLNKMRGIYRNKRDFLLGELKKYDWSEKISGDHAGLHVLAQIRTELDETELTGLAEKEGVRVYGISRYRLGEKGEQAGGGMLFDHPVLLLGYGKPKEEEISAGLAILHKIIKNRALH